MTTTRTRITTAVTAPYRALAAIWHPIKTGTLLAAGPAAAGWALLSLHSASGVDANSLIAGVLIGVIVAGLTAVGATEYAHRRNRRRQRRHRLRPGGPANPKMASATLSTAPTDADTCYRPGDGPYRSRGVLRDLEGR